MRLTTMGAAAEPIAWKFTCARMISFVGAHVVVPSHAVKITLRWSSPPNVTAGAF